MPVAVRVYAVISSAGAKPVRRHVPVTRRPIAPVAGDARQQRRGEPETHTYEMDEALADEGRPLPTLWGAASLGPAVVMVAPRLRRAPRV